MDIRKLAMETEQYIIERRRNYHTNPELSDHEENTRRSLIKDLRDIGIEDITEMKNHFGLTALIRGEKPGKTIGLRSDMDALPITEDTGLPFASCNGAMHACGHDAHMAILLGAAKMLYSIRSTLPGNVRLIFQPCEEYASGARWMMEEHLCDDIDALYGSHVWGELDAPLIDISTGNRMAGADLFDIEVYGTTAHGASPHLGNDAIAAGCAIVNNLQQCVSRMNDPLNPLVISIGEFIGGPRFNVISDHVHMRGTTRYFNNDRKIEDTMRMVIENTARAFGVKAELLYTYKSPAVINSFPEMNEIARHAVIDLFGEESIGVLAPSMGGEDFPILAEPGKPYFFAFVGSRNPAKGITEPNHNKAYTVDEDILCRAAALMVRFTFDYLNNN